MKNRIRWLCLIMAILVFINSETVCISATEEKPVTGTQSVVSTAPKKQSEQLSSVQETFPPQTAPLPNQTEVQKSIFPQEPVPEETEPVTSETQKNKSGDRRADVPQYFQNDYAETRYGYGTVASSGCGVTCLAMVATYLTGHDYLPDELAGYVGWRGQNNMERLEQGSILLKLPFTRNTNWHITRHAIQNGKIAIILMEEQSPFTATQHFVVVTGVSEDGKYYVNDPNRDNYGKWDLEDGFANGFDEYYMYTGFSGAWIYDKAQIPADPFIYEEEKYSGEPRYPGISLTLAQEDLLAKVVWVEARGESLEGQQAVAEVVFNRMMSGDFPDTLNDVIYGEGQFRSVPFLDDAEPNHTQYKAIEQALYGPYVLPTDVFYFATTPTNNMVWGRIGGHIFCYKE